MIFRTRAAMVAGMLASGMAVTACGGGQVQVESPTQTAPPTQTVPTIPPFDPEKVGTDQLVAGAQEVAKTWVRLVGEGRVSDACRLLTRKADLSTRIPGGYENGAGCVGGLTHSTSDPEVRHLWATSTIPQLKLNEQVDLPGVLMNMMDMRDAHGDKWSTLGKSDGGLFRTIQIQWVDSVDSASRWQITKLN